VPVLTHKHADIVLAVAPLGQGHVAAVPAEINPCGGETSGGGGTEYGYGGPKTKVQGGDVMQGFYNGKKLGVENYGQNTIFKKEA
jgi:hypothetical protein